MARTVALIAPVCPVLLRVSCSSETVPNGPKREESHQNMWLGSNGVDQECSLWKILKRHHGMNFCIYCISLSRFLRVSWSTETVPNAHKREETHRNMSLGSSGVDQERSLWKILTRHRGRTFALIAPVWRVFYQVLCSSKTVSNAPKQKETHQTWD